MGYSITTITNSKVTYDDRVLDWPSRDPIGDTVFFTERARKYLDYLDKGFLDYKTFKVKMDAIVGASYGNLFVFVSNDPLSYYDLHGLCEIHKDLEPSSSSNWNTVHLIKRKLTGKGDPATLHWDNPCSEGLVITNIETTDKPTPGSGNVTAALTMAVETRYALANYSHIGMGSATATITCCCPPEEE